MQKSLPQPIFLSSLLAAQISVEEFKLLEFRSESRLALAESYKKSSRVRNALHSYLVVEIPSSISRSEIFTIAELQLLK